MAIKIGDRSAAVRTLQERLKSSGFNPGGADGVFGKKTADAVRKFQAAKGLKVDALVGRNTQRALAADRNRDSFDPAKTTKRANTAATAETSKTADTGKGSATSTGDRKVASTTDGKVASTGNNKRPASTRDNQEVDSYADPKDTKKATSSNDTGKPDTRTSSVSGTQSSKSSNAVGTQLPASGKGYKSFAGNRDHQYGKESTIKSVQNIAAQYNKDTGKTLEIGEISQKGGGKLPPHVNHQKGTDIDIRPPSKEGGQTTWKSPGYDQDATRKLIASIKKENPNAHILFNDPQLIKEGLTHKAKGHDNHLHVSLR